MTTSNQSVREREVRSLMKRLGVSRETAESLWAVESSASPTGDVVFDPPLTPGEIRTHGLAAIVTGSKDREPPEHTAYPKRDPHLIEIT
jgi:hypothetical protein